MLLLSSVNLKTMEPGMRNPDEGMTPMYCCVQTHAIYANPVQKTVYRGSLSHSLAMQSPEMVKRVTKVCHRVLPITTVSREVEKEGFNCQVDIFYAVKVCDA